MRLMLQIWMEKLFYVYIEDPSNPVLDKYISATGAVTRKFWEKTAFLDALLSSAPDDLALIVLSDTGALTTVELLWQLVTQDVEN